MKKYFALSFLLTIATFNLLAIPTPPPSSDDSQSNDSLVELTESEKRIIDKIVSLNHQFEHLVFVLGIGCGIRPLKRSDTYDREKYPDCERTLEFLKKYAQQIDNLNSKSDKFYHELRTRGHARRDSRA